MVTDLHHRAFVVSGLPRRQITTKEDMEMSKKANRKIILINGIRYYADRPESCRKCFFWKNRKGGCILGSQNCYGIRGTSL